MNNQTSYSPYIILIFFFFLNINALSAQHIISGQVIDSEQRKALIGATIRIEGTNRGVVTDSIGKFSIELDSLPMMVIVSYVGYGSHSILINKDTPTTIFLSVKRYPKDSEVIIVYPDYWRQAQPTQNINNRALTLDNEVSTTAALNRIPGIHIQSGALNTNRLTIRGIGNRSPFSTRKIRAYFEGIPLTDGSGESAIEDIDMSLIRSIEVKKGPTGGNYGAGLGGVILLKAKGKNGIPNKANIETNTTLGSYGLFRNSTSLQLPFMDDEKTYRKKHAIYLNYNRTHSDGYRANNEFDRTGLGLVAQLAPNTNYGVTLLMNYTKSKAFIPSSLNETDYQSNPQNAASNWANVMGNEDYEKLNLGLSKVFFIADNDKIVVANQTSFFGRLRTNDELRPFNFLQENSNIIGIRSVFKLENKKNFGLKIGTEALSENLTWATFDGTQGAALSKNIEDRRYLNLFANAEGNINNRLSWELGANINRTKYQYRDELAGASLLKQQVFNWIVSPNIGLNYKIPFGYINHLFANAAHGFSPPSLEETLLPDGTRNLDIRPEVGWNYELGWRGKAQGGNLTYEASIYHMLIDDLLVAKRISEDQFQGINAGKTRHSGLETTLRYQRRLGSNLFFPFINYNYANYQFVDFIDGDNDYSGNALTGQAPHILNAGIQYRNDLNMYANIIYRYVDGFPMRDDNSVYSEAYQLLNTKLGYKFEVNKKWNFDIYLGINNALNAKYASQILINASSFGGNAPRYYYPGLPRNFYGGIKVNYRFL